MTADEIEFTRVANDINGNGRYVCHFLHLNTQAEREDRTLSTQAKYDIACKRANRIGGRKYRTKAYGGGIVFQSCSLGELRAAIARIVAD